MLHALRHQSVYFWVGSAFLAGVRLFVIASDL